MRPQPPVGRAGILLRYLRPYRLRVAALAGLVIVDVALATSLPLIVAGFIDEAVSGGPPHVLARWAGTYLLVGICNQVVALAAGRLAIDLAQRSTNDLRVDLTDHLLTLDVDFFSRHRSGELLEWVDGDTSTLERFFSYFVFDVIATSLLSVGIVTVALVTDVRLGLVLLAAGVLSIVAVGAAQRIARPVLRGERLARSRLTGFVEERLAVREDIRSSGAESYTLDRLARPLSGLRLSMTRAGAGLRASSSALELSVSLALGAVFAVGAVLLERDEIALGEVFLVYQYVSVLSWALSRLSLRLGDLAAATGSTDRIVDLLSLPGPDRTGTRTTPPPAPAVALRDVTFSYDGSYPALVDVTLEVPAGKSMALIGRSGSGKSTVSKLLWRAHDADRGEVLFDDTPLGRLDVDTLRRAVGVVTQDAYVFQASVRDNVALFDEQVPARLIHEALDAVGLHDWVASLHAGLETQLADGGTSLSTGQAHLLAMARVLVRDPQVVVMDEVTAHLDPATERRVRQAMQRLMAGRTAVVITHRGLVLEDVDYVAVLDNGHLTWTGARTSLPPELAGLLVKGAGS